MRQMEIPAQRVIEPQSTADVLASWRQSNEGPPVVPAVQVVTWAGALASPVETSERVQAVPDLEPPALGPVPEPRPEPEPEDQPRVLHELGLFLLVALIAITIAAVVAGIGVALTV